jgi:hypothetical protein
MLINAPSAWQVREVPGKAARNLETKLDFTTHKAWLVQPGPLQIAAEPSKARPPSVSPEPGLLDSANRRYWALEIPLEEVQPIAATIASGTSTRSQQVLLGTEALASLSVAFKPVLPAEADGVLDGVMFVGSTAGLISTLQKPEASTIDVALATAQLGVASADVAIDLAATLGRPIPYSEWITTALKVGCVVLKYGKKFYEISNVAPPDQPGREGGYELGLRGDAR